MSTFLAFRTAAVALSRHPKPIPSAIFPLLVRGLQAPRKYPKNHQIEQQQPLVQLKDENGSLGPPQRPSEILESMDLSTHVLRLVTSEPPIVQVFTLMEDKMRQLSHKAGKKAEKQKQSRGHILTKEIQLSWFTSGQDLEHRLSKIREELEKGNVRVDVILNPKAKVRNPTGLEMDEQLDEIARRVEDVGMEWRERDRRRGSATIFFQSTVKREPIQRLTEEEIRKRALEELEERQKQLQKKKRREEERLQSEHSDSTSSTP